MLLKIISMYRSGCFLFFFFPQALHKTFQRYFVIYTLQRNSVRCISWTKRGLRNGRLVAPDNTARKWCSWDPNPILPGSDALMHDALLPMLCMPKFPIHGAPVCRETKASQFQDESVALGEGPRLPPFVCSQLSPSSASLTRTPKAPRRQRVLG